jgi:RimJ/RimL family protein N-acetyltransferase
VNATLDHAFDDVGLEEVGAFARPANSASLRVLARCGFERFHFVPELERDWFVARRERRQHASVR